MFDDFVLDAVAGGNTGFDYGTPGNAQRLLTRFNLEIESVINRYGLDAVGTAIWYLYGCAGITHDVLDDSVASGYGDFYRSVRSLYDNGFAKYCDNYRGHSDHSGGRFETACYMIWDMDSGFEYLSFNRSTERFHFAEQLIDFGLRHHHAAVQESFLHCLGHRHSQMPEFVTGKIAAFLRRNDLSPAIREYAKECRTGMIL